MIAGNGVLVHGLGGTYPDQLDAAGPEDLLVCVTQNPYGRQTLEAARDCRQAGVPVLALTDSPLAPIQAHATQALLFDAGTPSYFHSMVGSLALVERLLAKLPPPAARPRNSASTPSSGGWTRPAPISAARRRPRAGAPGKHDRIPRRRPRLRPAHPHHVPRLIVSRQQIHPGARAVAFRRRFSLCMALAAAGLAGPAASRAQDAAKRPPIRLVVPFAAGARPMCWPACWPRNCARSWASPCWSRTRAGGRQHRRRRSGARGRRRRDAHDGHARSAGGEPVSLSQAGLQRRKGFLRDQQRGLRGQRADGQRPERHPRLA